MKRSGIAILMLLTIISLNACKDKNKEKENQSVPSQQTNETAAGANSAAEPKSYTITAVPDSVSMGKNKEAFIKIKDLKAIELSKSDGTSDGMELSYKIELTNKNAIGGSEIGLATTDFRLELDNGNKISPNSIFVNAAPEATKLSDYDKFTIPAGAKPVALILFFDQTKATVKLEMK